MSLKERLENGLKEAMKSGDRVAVSAIRLSLSEIKNAAIDKRRPLEDAEVVNILRSGVKKRQESIELFAKGARADLVEKETAELRVVEGYLPAGLSAAELEALVDAAIAGDRCRVDEGDRQGHEGGAAEGRRPGRRRRGQQDRPRQAPRVARVPPPPLTFRSNAPVRVAFRCGPPPSSPVPATISGVHFLESRHDRYMTEEERT